jgi:meso-butanediol dehydrogenase / (S,S)-butanediol dehydrogenase / diacetyl reductase
VIGLDQRVGVVTGAAQGIGLATARRLAAEGMRVALVDVQADAIAAVADELGPAAAAFPADLRDTAAIPGLLEAVTAELGPVDALAHAAGVSRSGPPTDVDEVEWDRVHDLNLKATFFLGRALAIDMAARGGGAIVNVASITGKRAATHLAHYSASKAGVISVTQSLAQFFGPGGVRVNAVCPGIVWTPMLEASLERRAREDPAYRARGATARDVYEDLVRTETVLGRPTEAEDVANLTAFLLSAGAGAITGQSINVDSGMQFD